MTPETDSDLLGQFAEHQSETAFAALVERHVNLVYSVAVRETGDGSQAGEITQAVFIILARKVSQLRHRRALAGWLFQTTRLTAKNFLRSELRRRRREQEAYVQSTLEHSGDVSSSAAADDTVWQQLAPLLDAAVETLGEADRCALVLRFYEGHTLREVGAVLGANEAAAKKRVSRALEKLRKLFAKRGVTFSVALISAAISAHSVQAAPLGLAKTISVVAATNGAAATASTLTLVKGALKLMAWAKFKTGVLVGVAVLLAAGGTTVIVKSATHPATVAANDKIWDQYYQILANDTNREQTATLVNQLMRSRPPMAVIRLTPPEQRRRPQFRIPGVRGRTSGWGTEFGHFALGEPLRMILIYAYNLDPTNYPLPRLVIPSDLESYPQSPQYDYIDTLPQGGRKKLQQALKDQFGLVVRRELRSNLVLRVKTPGASGLHPHGTAGDGFTARNVTMPALAKELRRIFGVDVTDATGLTNGYDYTLDYLRDLPRPPTPDDLKHALEDQLGLELTPATDNQSVEFVVVEKLK